ncbi:MAG: alanine racemase [Acidimicrobiales bacterium]|jgi:D-serine deaminase-like pyridoxal phosphate-dependent protein
MYLGELTTPALVVDRQALDFNVSAMAHALPGSRLRPHVKAHKCTELARQQRDAGHRGFTCATIRECEGMAASGLGEDLLLANEVLDARRLGTLVAHGHRVTVAVDSDETIAAAAVGGVREVLIDVNVGLPRCGCTPADATRLADLARKHGLEVRGVMGYEGHVVGIEAADERAVGCQRSMELLLGAHDQVGGEIISAGGTGTYAINTWATEIEAGTYVLMDTAYARLGLPFRQAVFVAATVISRSDGYAVADCGLKALGMDHGNPSIAGAEVWFCSDEHVTFAPDAPVGTMVLVQPAHLDPTLAYHERLHLVEAFPASPPGAGAPRDAEIIDVWPIDLRGW